MHDTLTEDKKDAKVIINLPKIEEKETQALTTALVNMTNSLTVAVEEGWISKGKAKEVYVYMLSYIGKEIEPEEEKDMEEEIEKMDPKLKELYLKAKQEYMRKKKAGKIETEEEEE